jgi:hypothetical protein
MVASNGCIAASEGLLINLLAQRERYGISYIHVDDARYVPVRRWLMETREQVGGLVAALSVSAWALTSLDACLEAGLLEYLTEPHSSAELSERTGVPAALVEALLDLLVALGLVRRAGDAFTAAPGLQPLLTPPARDYLLRAMCARRFCRAARSWMARSEGRFGQAGPIPIRNSWRRKEQARPALPLRGCSPSVSSRDWKG